MRRILDGAGPAEAGAFVASLRAALSGPPCPATLSGPIAVR
jgi:hypothetical protein